MTEPRSGPADQPGQPGGSPASGPPADRGQGNMGQGITGSGDTGTHPAGQAAGETAGQGGDVKTRTSAAQPTVPQQYGPQAERAMEPGAAPMPGIGADASGMVAAAAGRAWPGIVLCGLGLVALGIMLLVWPAVALTLAAVLIGAAVLVAGLAKLFEAFTASNQSGGMRAGYVVIGLLAVLAGSYLLVHHAVSLFLVAFVTGLFFMVHGVADIGAAVTENVPGRTWRAVLGVFSIGAGIIMLVWPAITLTLLVLIVAAWLLLYGLMLCGLAYSLRKASKEGSAGAAQRAPSFRKRKLAAGAR